MLGRDGRLTFQSKASVSDVGVLIDISHLTISASFRRFLGDQKVDDLLESGAGDQYVRENLDRCSVVMQQDEVVGFAVCRTT